MKYTSAELDRNINVTKDHLIGKCRLNLQYFSYIRLLTVLGMSPSEVTKSMSHQSINLITQQSKYSTNPMQCLMLSVNLDDPHHQFSVY